MPEGALAIVKQVALALVGLYAALAAGWNLFVAPVFGVSPLSFGEALGLTILVGGLITVVYLLREEQE